ncbi:unnamed protein product [Ilex paraguariensis]|uniref:Uncharacterized protein n=1 Tax=Ilex paraguariensis TaxID=185542 RepID=A0ABC8S4A8_9AQUA
MKIVLEIEVDDFNIQDISMEVEDSEEGNCSSEDLFLKFDLRCEFRLNSEDILGDAITLFKNEDSPKNCFEAYHKISKLSPFKLTFGFCIYSGGCHLSFGFGMLGNGEASNLGMRVICNERRTLEPKCSDELVYTGKELVIHEQIDSKFFLDALVSIPLEVPSKLLLPWLLYVISGEEKGDWIEMGGDESVVNDYFMFDEEKWVVFMHYYKDVNIHFCYCVREQGNYKNPTNYCGWRRPPVEEVLSKLTTHFVKVHSRQCIDEAELAEHVVGLTCSLATSQFRKKLTRLSVNANGCLIPKDCVDKSLVKKSLWLKALVAIPKVQPRFAIAISRKYPTMKSLLNVYMDPSKSVHEKEFLLKDLTTEGLLGEDRRLGEVCSKRVYRILMAQCGSIKTDDVEEGADFFSRSI